MCENFIFLIFIPIAVALETKNCLVKENSNELSHYRHFSPNYFYTLKNCTENTYCCDGGCCSILWYTGPLAIFLVIILICCLTCLKACWDVYHENTRTDYNFEDNLDSVRSNMRREIPTLRSPPPDYSIAIYFPQPERNRIPSYEEVIRESEL